MFRACSTRFLYHLNIFFRHFASLFGKHRQLGSQENKRYFVLYHRKKIKCSGSVEIVFCAIKFTVCIIGFCSARAKNRGVFFQETPVPSMHEPR